jgi:hypothetical protein
LTFSTSTQFCLRGRLCQSLSINYGRLVLLSCICPCTAFFVSASFHHRRSIPYHMRLPATCSPGPVGAHGEVEWRAAGGPGRSLTVLEHLAFSTHNTCIRRLQHAFPPKAHAPTWPSLSIHSSLLAGPPQLASVTRLPSYIQACVPRRPPHPRHPTQHARCAHANDHAAPWPGGIPRLASLASRCQPATRNRGVLGTGVLGWPRGAVPGHLASFAWRVAGVLMAEHERLLFYAVACTRAMSSLVLRACSLLSAVSRGAVILRFESHARASGPLCTCLAAVVSFRMPSNGHVRVCAYKHHVRRRS